MNVIFSDLNVELGSTSPYELVYNEFSINASILTILGTRKNSRVFRRNFGSYLEDVLFDPLDEATAVRIRQEIIDAVSEWETRVQLKKSVVIPDYENQMYYVSLEYVVPMLSNKSVALTFNLVPKVK